MATARFAYHVHRNYRPNTEPRAWAEALVSRFDDIDQADVCYLPAIVRHALMAKRMPGEEEE